VAKKLACATSKTRTAEAEFDTTQAQNKIKLERALGIAQMNLIECKNKAKMEKIRVKVKSEMKLIQEKSSVEAVALQRNQEIKTGSYQIEAEAQSQAFKIRTIAEAKRDADLLEAEGLSAIAEAQIQNYSHPSLLQLEMMKCWIQGIGHLTKVAQPTIVLQTAGKKKIGGEGPNS